MWLLLMYVSSYGILYVQWVREVAAVKGKENWTKLTVEERKQSILSLRGRKDGPKVSWLSSIAVVLLR